MFDVNLGEILIIVIGLLLFITIFSFFMEKNNKTLKSFPHLSLSTSFHP